MVSTIQARLAAIANENDVRVLFAVESGSRAWGFESPDSDWDVRFIYVRPLGSYLTIHPFRDVIEVMDDPLDFAGWDLPKALRLFQKSNPALMEWLDSPLVYSQDDSFVGELKALAPSVVSLDAGIHHYLSMARTNYERNFQGEQVSLKKYFYVLRPILAGLFIEQERRWPPTLFGALTNEVPLDGAVRDSIEDLLAKKRLASEVGFGPRVPALDDFIERMLVRLGEIRFEKPKEDSTPALDALFRRFVRAT